MPADYFSCPNCGEDVPVKARVCPHCGADEETGWKSPDYSHAFPEIDDDFDYEEFLDEEFGTKPKIKPRGMSWFIWFLALILIVALALLFIS